MNNSFPIKAARILFQIWTKRKKKIKKRVYASVALFPMPAVGTPPPFSLRNAS